MKRMVVFCGTENYVMVQDTGACFFKDCRIIDFEVHKEGLFSLLELLNQRMLIRNSWMLTLLCKNVERTKKRARIS